MAATINIYSCLTEHLNRSTIDPDTDQFLITFLKSSYTANINSHTQLSDLNLASNEFSITQFGYTAGGMVCSPLTVSRTNNITTVSLPNFTLTSAGGTLPVWRTYAIFANVARNSVTGPLVCYGLGNDASGGTDIGPKVDGAGFTLRWNVSGLYRVQS